VGDSSGDWSIGHRFGLSGLIGQGEVAKNVLRQQHISPEPPENAKGSREWDLMRDRSRTLKPDGSSGELAGGVRCLL
jgi:hypothetical protein